MKHKFRIVREPEKKQLFIKEYGELDKDTLSFLCEAAYDEAQIGDAIKKGKSAVVATLRTENMYPPNLYADRIADIVIGLFQPESESQEAEVIFDDLEWLTRDQEEEYPPEEDIETDEDEDIDDLLDDDYEEDFEDDDDLDISNSSLKVADDDSGDFDEE